MNGAGDGMLIAFTELPTVASGITTAATTAAAMARRIATLMPMRRPSRTARTVNCGFGRGGRGGGPGVPITGGCVDAGWTLPSPGRERVLPEEEAWSLLNLGRAYLS